MKSLSITVITVAILGLLAYTNPKPNDYERFIHELIMQETNKRKDDLERVLGQVFGGIASTMITNQTVRADYVFLSTYDTKLGNERLKALGILNNFIVLETPPSLKDRPK